MQLSKQDIKRACGQALDADELLQLFQPLGRHI